MRKTEQTIQKPYWPCRKCYKDMSEDTPKGDFCCPKCRDDYTRAIASKKVMAAICTKQTISTPMFSTLPGPLFKHIKVNTAFPLDQARNDLMTAFLDEKELTHIMWIDSDVVCAPNMADLLQIDAPLIAPLCWIGGPIKGFVIPVPGLYRWNDQSAEKAFTTWSYKDVMEAIQLSAIERRPPIVDVDLVGGGVWMVDRATAAKLVDDCGQWFRLTWQEGHKIRHGEDVYFFEQCKAAGLKFKVHLGVECGHMKEMDMRYFAHVIYGRMPPELYEGIDSGEAPGDGP